MTEQQFDVFLAHSSKDKPLIRCIYRKLTELGIRPWLDEEEIAPGTKFQDEIQQAIGRIKTVGIFFGQGGLGRWQALELKSFITQCVKRDIPVIPIMLPGVEEIPEELIFLQEFHSVSFRNGIEDENALFSLEWGITGKKPQRKNAHSQIILTNPPFSTAKIRQTSSEFSSLKEHSPTNKDSDSKRLSKKYSSERILFIKNVKNPLAEWAYQLKSKQEDDFEKSLRRRNFAVIQERSFELMWRLSAHGVNLPKTGDVMILHQRAKVTHLVRFLNEQVRETDSGYFRWVKVIWMPTQQDWYKLPHQKEILGFIPRYSDGNTHDLRSPNFLTFKEAWGKLSDFQLHLVERLQELDSVKNARSY